MGFFGKMVYQMGTDKTGSTGDENFHTEFINEDFFVTFKLNVTLRRFYRNYKQPSQGFFKIRVIRGKSFLLGVTNFHTEFINEDFFYDQLLLMILRMVAKIVSKRYGFANTSLIPERRSSERVDVSRKPEETITFTFGFIA